MKHIHNPQIDLRYWVLISLASIFGTNTGDLAVRWYKLAAELFDLPMLLGFKHLGPLPILVVLFGLIYLIEKIDARKIELYFWTAIIIIRTAATNIADGLNDDVHLPIAISIGIFVFCLLVGALIWQHKRQQPLNDIFIPNSNLFYWVMMCVAGILGTLIGDELAHSLGLQFASLLLTILMVGLVAIGYQKFLIFTAMYWFGIAFARIAGTAVGDWLAKSVERGGAGLGLPLATLVSGLLFILVAIFWKTKKRDITL
jgi:uncharacterized membrane-anchored protein